MSFQFNCYIDAEWGSEETKYETLSLQVLLEMENSFSSQYCVVNEKYRKYFSPDIEKTFPKVKLIFHDFDDSKDILSQILEKELLASNFLPAVGTFYCNLYFFYSPKDLWIGFGWDRFNWLLGEPINLYKSFVQKRRCISGRLLNDPSKEENTYQYKIIYSFKDLRGWTNSGLVSLAQSLGLEVNEKTELDLYKSQMEKALVEETLLFIRYAMNDVVLLRQILFGQVKLINRVCREVLQLNCSFTTNTIPMTTGKLVSTIFENYLYSLADKSALAADIADKSILLKLVFGKLGILNTSNRRYRTNRIIHNELFTRCQNVDDFFTIDNLEDEFVKTKKKEKVDYTKLPTHQLLDEYLKRFDGMYKYLGFSLASIGYILNAFENTTADQLALVHGGRANNEKYWKVSTKYALDIDLVSAYGSGLRSLIYPLGRPLVYCRLENDPVIKLGTFLQQKQGQLVDGLYKIVVSGSLSFEQDLIFSKIASKTAIKKFQADLSGKFSREHSNDRAYFESDFLLLRREIHNGVITSSVLQMLQAVCTNKELNEIMNLEVVSAIYYPKSERTESLDDWINEVLKSPGRLVFDTKNQGRSDQRTAAWYGVPIENFIGRLVDYRKKLKAQAKQEKDPVKRKELMALQNGIKLIVNILYGVTTSPFFQAGNTVVCEQVTSKARVLSWSLAKSLGLSQSITDGGLYGSMETWCFDFSKTTKWKPGLHTFADVRSRLPKHRNIKTKPLGDVDWVKVFENPTSKESLEHFNNADKYAFDHLKKFWSVYGLDWKSGVEHKLDRSAIRASWFSKAHYYQIPFNSETGLWDRDHFAIRGARPGEHAHPMYAILKEFVKKNPNLESINLDYSHTYLLNIEEYRLRQQSRTLSPEQKKIRPGERVVTSRILRINNTHMPVDTLEEYKSRIRRGLSKKNKLLFEKFFAEGFEVLMNHMLQNDLSPEKRNILVENPENHIGVLIEELETEFQERENVD